MLELTRRMLEAHHTRGLCTFFVYGKYGYGKTSLLLHAAKEYFESLFRLKKVDAWFTALDHLYFNPMEALLYVEAYKQDHPGERVPLLGMDDVGQHLPRARWWREDVVEFREWVGVARSDTSAIGFTAPTQLSLPGGILDACFLRLHVKKDYEERGMSKAYAYEVSVTPYFQPMVSGPKFVDIFPTHYPDFVYEEYQAMREASVAPLRRSLMEKMGTDEVIMKLKGMGLKNTTIGRITRLDNSTIGKHLKNMDLERLDG